MDVSGSELFFTAENALVTENPGGSDGVFIYVFSLVIYKSALATFARLRWSCPRHCEGHFVAPARVT